ncbi:hypothetical protein TSUD_288200 [Trifolium subterraneum]|uniref:Uncharacterized protein n=1 Tax=Trifolium subterraneum TaxID=3900 RepID=A0A2Z6NWD6_TRISU|nr:hypothetical protein TSUD_288200 [Trifolium subterraneum]
MKGMLRENLDYMITTPWLVEHFLEIVEDLQSLAAQLSPLQLVPNEGMVGDDVSLKILPPLLKGRKVQGFFIRGCLGLLKLWLKLMKFILLAISPYRLTHLF